MQENRAFDNYFWTWPGQMGYTPSICMPYNPQNPNTGCLSPKLARSPALSGDLPHDWTSWKSHNNGSMNGFLEAANPNPSGSSTTTAAAGINGGLQFVNDDPD